MLLKKHIIGHILSILFFFNNSHFYLYDWLIEKAVFFKLQRPETNTDSKVEDSAIKNKDKGG